MIYTITPASIAALVKLQGPHGAQEWAYMADGKDPAPTPLTAHQGGRWFDLPPIVRQAIDHHFAAVFALPPEYRGDHLLDCGPITVLDGTPSWAVEVVADRSRTWAGNAMRYATHEEACAAARDLMNRWTLVIEWRVVPSEDPVTPRPAENVPRSKWRHNAPTTIGAQHERS